MSAAKLVGVVGFLGVGGYVAAGMMKHDPSIVPMSRAQIEQKLARAETRLPDDHDNGGTRIWGRGPSRKGVSLAMRYSDTAPLQECDAVITEVEPGKSRVTSDCTDGETRDSALARTTDALQAAMFEEHIRAILHDTSFDYDRVHAADQRIVMRNLGDMQKEALGEHDKLQRELAESRN